jgi:8-oxo-dGTP pyrophosphatase MutT (NUDIX family)
VTEVPVRDAATVVLLRDGESGIEAWLLTRVTSMVFAGGMAVFPGGRVDAADAQLPFVPGSDEHAVRRFGYPPDEVRALVGAAVREVFEETGVLLTTPVADLAEARAAVEAGTLPFGELLDEHGLAVDGSAVRPWSRWITPEGEVRRYDTRFFVAALPDGAQPQNVTTESSSAGWFDIHAALRSAERGEIVLLPPTILTLTAMASYLTVAEVLDAAEQRSLEPVAPDVERNADGDFVAKLQDGTAFVLPRALFTR